MSAATIHPEALVRLTGPKGGHGTGFIIRHDAAGTYILTCRHVIDEVSDTRVDVLVDHTYPAATVVYPPDDGPDLAVLMSTAPELRARAPLQLGRASLKMNTYILSYQRLTQDEAEGPDLNPFPLDSPLPPKFKLRNDLNHRIIHGHSGSPVIDGNTQHVIGVVTEVTQFSTATADDRDAIITATAIEQLTDCWPHMPPDLIATAVTGPSLDLKPVLAKVQLLGGVRLRVLLAASAPAPYADVNNETSLVIDTLQRALIQSGLRAFFDVDVAQWIDHQTVRRVLSTTQPSGVTLPCPPPSDFDAVIFIIWHNLGPQHDELGLEALERSTRSAAQHDMLGRPLRLVYRRRDRILTYSDDPQRPAIDRHTQQVDGLFQQLPPGEPRAYAVDQFADQFLVDLRQLIDDLVEAELRQQPDRSARAPTAIQLPVNVNPYRGLEIYRAEHAALFYGRAAEVNRLREIVAEDRDGFIAVVGASGSGKSSLARAGLLHRLQINAIPGSDQWRVVDLALAHRDDFTGELQAPLKTAALTLFALPSVRVHYATAGELARDLRLDRVSVGNIVERALTDRPADARLVLFIDQFEELFTLVQDEGDRREFIRFLCNFIQPRRANVIVTLRADYYPRCLETDLAALLKDGLFSLTAPDPQALLAMVVRPALFSGLDFEDDMLPLEIVRDAGSSAGALPLMSYALEQLARSPTADRKLTRRAYLALGGVQGVIQQKAEEAVRQLPATVDVPAGARILFRQLVRMDVNGVPAKQPASFAPDDPAWTPGARLLAQALVSQRLLQTDLDPQGRPVLEIAHEALLRNWQLLRQWIEETRAALILLSRVELAAREWQEARSQAATDEERLECDRRYLWPDERLQPVAEALDLLGTPDAELSEVVRAFIQPERDRLLRELEHPIEHQRRDWIGARLAVLGDPRRGVGLRADGLPDLTWCRVPGGSITIYQDESMQEAIGTFDVAPFYIAKYLVTLRQFQVFTALPVYFDLRWWMDLPVDPRQHEPFVQRPDIPNYPAQYVSWYQALAYCRWLSAQLGYAVRLPAEWEWQQAATGGEARDYPWGSVWQPDYANHKEAMYRLLAVGLYPQGASPVGALDMAGNIYEWCQNEYDPIGSVAISAAKRVTRGGAWFKFFGEVRDQLKVYHRTGEKPDGTNQRGDRIGVGLRLACDRPPPDALSEEHIV